MNQMQMQFLYQIADRIPRLFAALQEGNQRSEYVLGKRIIRGRQVRLVLMAEVVDPGHNPLATHSSDITIKNEKHYVAESSQESAEPEQN